MASEKGTLLAVPSQGTYGHDKLLDALISFLTTNPALVAAGQNWELIKDTGATASINEERDVYLKGKGLAGTDEIFIGIKRYTNDVAVAPYFNWLIYGMDGFNSDSTMEQQPNVSPYHVYVLYPQDIVYSFHANGRRFVVNTICGTFHTNIYVGLIIPYATADEYPYPLVVLCSGTAAAFSYTNPQSDNINGFFQPRTSESVYYTTAIKRAPGSYRRTDGAWFGILNYPILSDSRIPYQLGLLFPNYSADTVYYDLDGNFILKPIELLVYNDSQRNAGSILGELDGVLWGVGSPYNFPLDTITDSDGHVYVGMADGTRTGANNFSFVLED